LLNATILLALALLGVNGAAQAQSQALINEVNTVGTATTGVPVVQNFTISTAGTYQVTLTDIGYGLTAPLASAPLATTPPVELAVTQGTTVVATVSGTTRGVAQLSFTATANTTYTLRVTGAPGTQPGSGPIGLQVTGGPSNATVFSFTGALALPATALSPNEVAINRTFTVPSSGNYTIALSDLQLPSALGTLTLIVLEPTSCSFNNVAGVCTILTSNNGAAATATLALDSTKSYQIFAVGQLATGVSGGLYSVTVTPAGGGSPVFNQAVPLGAVQSIGSATLTAAAQSLTLTDLAFPAALSQLSAVVVQNGSSVASQTGAGTQTFTPAAGSYQIYALASPVSSSAGSFALTLGPSGSPVFSTVQVAGNGAATQAAFVVSGNVATAGSYQLRLADFQIPAALVSSSAALVQNGVVVGTPLTAAGSAAAASLSAGTIYAVVVADSTSSGGLVGVDVVPAAGGTAVLASTQGVGGAFSSTPLTVTATGNYTVQLQDVGFPATFANLDLVVTQGTQNLGSIFGGGSSIFNATSTGTYSLNFIAQPQITVLAGTYALAVTPTPPAPTVTLTSSSSSVASGGTVTLTWSSTNATSCAASGGWSGTGLAASGTETSPTISAATTFTLTCTGAGGSTPASVTVTLAAPGKGGGSLGAEFLGGLAALAAAASRNRRQVVVSA